MPRLRSRRARALAAGVLAGLGGCSAAPAEPAPEANTALSATAAPALARLGLMSSLPLTWPLGAEMGEIATGRAPVPWQRRAIAAGYAIEPLDTLSPIPALDPGAEDTDPLAGLDRLAVIQPRGLSPADNLALDRWVRGGGRLLLALDPALTGDYDLPLGDPRRPVDAAPIPPVVARWGLAVRFDDAQAATVTQRALGEAALPLVLAGEVTIADPAAAHCTLLAGGAAARCRVGAGQITLIADAALFEHPELAGEGGAGLRAVLAEALE
jgi:hypothetical protein